MGVTGATYLSSMYLCVSTKSFWLFDPFKQLIVHDLKNITHSVILFGLDAKKTTKCTLKVNDVIRGILKQKTNENQ